MKPPAPSPGVGDGFPARDFCVCSQAMKKNVFWSFVVLAGSIGLAGAVSPFREVLHFSIVHDAGFGNEIFIAGNHPDAGNWNPTLGAKLVYNPGNLWTGSVALQAGTALDYKAVVIPNSHTGICQGANWNYLPPGDGNHATTNAAPQPAAPYAGKTIYYHSGLTNVSIIYAINGGDFTGASLAQIGPGRAPGEFLHKVEGIGVPGGSIEFVFSGMANGVTVYDHAPHPGYGTAPANNYFTTLDAFFVQDGDVFNYQPPGTVSAPSIINSNVVSTFSPSPSRTMKIYLPRGYQQNTWKRYPVMYMHDGENVFSPGGTYGSWDANLTATREISQGRMREVIVVALNSTENRTREYLPPEDNYGGQGFGDTYAKFLVHDVKAKIDREFRTLPDRENTMTAGSSSGGLITTYLGWSTNVFGKIGSFSPAYVISPNFNARIAADPKQPLRIYTDVGTFGGDVEAQLVPDYWVVLDHLLRDGYVQHLDLLSWLACDAQHNEAAWAARLPVAFRFLLNIWDEANELAGAAIPPEMDDVTMSPGSIQFSLNTLGGWRYRVDLWDRLGAEEWPDGTNVFKETLPWSVRNLSAPVTSGTVQFFRVTAF